MICTVALLRHGGSHLIRPIVAKLGVTQIVEPGKKKAPLDVAQGPVVVFLRDPRNRMVATWRWWSQQPGKDLRLRHAAGTPDGQIAWLLSKADGGFLPDMLRWGRVWCGWPGALTVRFEDMPLRGTEEIARIAAHLGKPRDYQRDAEIYDGIWLKGRTYTGKHSDWRDYFGPQANKAWSENGGPELLDVMGYA